MKKEEIMITIPASKVDYLLKLMNKSVKKIDGLEWSIGKTYKKNFRHAVVEDGGHVHFERWSHTVVDIEVLIPMENDWQLLAVVEEGVMAIINKRERLVLRDGHGKDYRICDVCKHRQFKESYIVRNTKTNEELQVGKECAKKFGIGLAHAIHVLMSELYETLDLRGDSGEDWDTPTWRGGKDIMAMRSVETSIIVQAAKKNFDDNHGVWKKGYYTESGYYSPSQSMVDIRNSLKDFEANENDAYFIELKKWLNEEFVPDSEFGESIQAVGTDFYMSEGDCAAAFFAIKQYEQYKKEKEAKEKGIYFPKTGDYIHIRGKVMNSETKVGYFGKYVVYDIFNEIDNNVYVKSGALNVDEEGRVEGYAMVYDARYGKNSLERVCKKAKKGLVIANENIN